MNSVKLKPFSRERERERERQTDRQTERECEREGKRERNTGYTLNSSSCILVYLLDNQ